MRTFAAVANEKVEIPQSKSSSLLQWQIYMFIGISAEDAGRLLTH